MHGEITKKINWLVKPRSLVKFWYIDHGLLEMMWLRAVCLNLEGGLVQATKTRSTSVYYYTKLAYISHGIGKCLITTETFTDSTASKTCILRKGNNLRFLIPDWKSLVGLKFLAHAQAKGPWKTSYVYPASSISLTTRLACSRWPEVGEIEQRVNAKAA